MEHQREVDGSVIVLSVGELEVDGDGVVIIVLGESDLIVDRVAVFVGAHGGQCASVGSAVIDVSEVHCKNATRNRKTTTVKNFFYSLSNCS